MKKRRQSKILELIKRYNIETQEELTARLKEEGFDVTQATASRDIRELNLVKVEGINKKYKYSKIDINNQNVESFDDNQLTSYRAKNVGFIFQFYKLTYNLCTLHKN